MPAPISRTMVACTQTTPDRQVSARGLPLLTLPVGMAQPMPNDVIWPEHPDIRGRDLLPPNVRDQELPQELADSTEHWRLLHPYEQRGTLNPSADTPGNLRRLVENEELVESLQIMEYLTDHPTSWFKTGQPVLPNKIWRPVLSSCWTPKIQPGASHALTARRKARNGIFQASGWDQCIQWTLREHDPLKENPKD